MNKTLTFALTGIFAAGMIFLSSAQTKAITVTGTIVDSATGSPVSGAMVLLYATSDTSIDINNLGSLKLDTAFSGTNGKFQHQMTISAQAYFLVYGVLKEGYFIKYPSYPSLILFTTVTLPTIEISKIDTSVRDTLQVTGTVVDSVTEVGIGGAFVIMSTGGGFDTAGNTVLTNSDGTFSKQVIISKVNGVSTVSYIVTDQHYITALGQNQANGKQLNLGTITLKNKGSAIRPETKPVSLSVRKIGMSVYSLNGRLLYEGGAQAIERIVRNYRSAVIVTIKYDNARMAIIKYTPIK